MGGKRPDQHNIDPAEAGATDYKNLPQTGRGHSNLDDTIELDRQQLSESEAELESRGIPAPGRRPAPSQDANRGVRAEQAADEEIFDEPGAKDADSDTGNPLV